MTSAHEAEYLLPARRPSNQSATEKDTLQSAACSIVTESDDRRDSRVTDLHSAGASRDPCVSGAKRQCNGVASGRLSPSPTASGEGVSANESDSPNPVQPTSSAGLCSVCGSSLATEKIFYRKHALCMACSKSPCVTVNGKNQRFCQQCGKFHDVSAFDDQKRTCRDRLHRHNANRRRNKQLQRAQLEELRRSLASIGQAGVQAQSVEPAADGIREVGQWNVAPRAARSARAGPPAASAAASLHSVDVSGAAADLPPGGTAAAAAPSLQDEAVLGAARHEDRRASVVTPTTDAGSGGRAAPGSCSVGMSILAEAAAEGALEPSTVTTLRLKDMRDPKKDVVATLRSLGDHTSVELPAGAELPAGTISELIRAHQLVHQTKVSALLSAPAAAAAAASSPVLLPESLLPQQWSGNACPPPPSSSWQWTPEPVTNMAPPGCGFPDSNVASAGRMPGPSTGTVVFIPMQQSMPTDASPSAQYHLVSPWEDRGSQATQFMVPSPVMAAPRPGAMGGATCDSSQPPQPQPLPLPQAVPCHPARGCHLQQVVPVDGTMPELGGLPNCKGPALWLQPGPVLPHDPAALRWSVPAGASAGAGAAPGARFFAAGAQKRKRHASHNSTASEVAFGHDRSIRACSAGSL